MTLRSAVDSLTDWLHQKNLEIKEMQEYYKKRYDDELFLYNLKEKPMPRKTKIALIRVLLICLFVLVVFLVVWVMQ